MRRRGGMVAGQAGARLPVLRDRSRPCNRGATARCGPRTRSGLRVARHPGKRSRLADRDAFGEMPELPGDLGLQAGTRRADLRFLRLARARSLRRNQGADSARERAAVQNQTRAMCATKCTPGIAAAGLRPIVSRAARSPTRSTAFTCRIGPSTRRSPHNGRAEAGYYYYTTETYRDSNGKNQTRQVQHMRWEPASGALDHFFDDELVPASRGVPADLLRRDRAFPDQGTGAIRCRLRFRLGGRAVSNRSRGGGAEFARSDGREVAPALRRTNSRRHLSQPRSRR